MSRGAALNDATANQGAVDQLHRPRLCRLGGSEFDSTATISDLQ